MRLIHQLLLIVAVGIALPAPVVGQSRSSTGGPVPLRVFLDCDDCFDDYLRTTITFVDWVRDPQDAEVHVLITTARTGSGGDEHTLAIIGRGMFTGIEDTVRHATRPSDTEDAIRRALAQALRRALQQFQARARAEGRERLEMAARPQTLPATDPWRGWVFSLRAMGTADAEQSAREIELSASISIDRVTPEWKMAFGTELEHQAERFDVDDEVVRSERREREANGLVVKSLGEHWAAGVTGTVGSSTFENVRRVVRFAPAIEFNIFPYSEFTRRELRVLYELGGEVADYYEETIFGRISDSLLRHELSATLARRETWGTLEARAEVSQYLQEPRWHRLELSTDVSIRIVRGLSFTVEGEYSRIRDQITLPRRDASPQEILLRQRELASNFEYNVSIGITYTFGSIFTNIVNPRFGQ